jgi:biotin carboxyl carrier protein
MSRIDDAGRDGRRWRLTIIGVDEDRVIDLDAASPDAGAPPDAHAEAPPDAEPPAADAEARRGAEAPPSAAAEAPRGTEVRSLPPIGDDLAAGRRRHEVTIDGWVITVTAEPAARAELRERALRAGGGAGHGGPQSIKARIPGRVARVWAAAGDVVAAGDRLLSVEAMKMENEIRSPVAGTVLAIHVAVDDRVELGAELAVVE